MSSFSSLWTMGGVASAHMPYFFVAPPGMVFAAQRSTAQVDGNVSAQVTEAVLPRSPAIVGHDDVVMSESGRTSVRSDHRSRTSRSHTRSRKPSPSASSSDSDSSAEERKRRSSKRSSKSRRSPRKSRRSPSRSIKSERTSRSGRTSRSHMSGASQVALNTMRTTQDLLSRKESNQAHLGQQVQQAFHAIQALAVRGSPPEGRSSPSVPDRAGRSDLPPRPPAPDPAARTPASPRTVDAARAEGAHTALESARVEFEERWQQREANAEAEKVAWVADVQKTLSAQLEAFQQKIHKQSKKTDAKKPAKKDSNKKHSRQDGDPSRASSGGESSDEGYSSSDSSSSDEVSAYTTTAAITQGGSVVTLRTFTNTLEVFDEKLSFSLTREDLIHEVYRVMNSVGWKPRDPSAGPRPPPPRQPQQPGFRPNNPDRMGFCENCKKWGHRPENCWTVMVCDRCHRHGHPTQRCETKACLKCDQIHDGRCEDWRAFQEIKKLLQQGGLADLPSHIQEDILNGKGDSEGAQLNY
ncbi:Hypothetical protein PHPALM_7132 [Phytophthora palmivora]|uniref:CCHC-type domain-containing protein n=1 Tax=Phytophthora palmivora TaxID=4796 RepID=A0A2P4YD37_9STRA|nr:Hypothetical protein PHPALM_7132 [Phytophthora palmivora]